MSLQERFALTRARVDAAAARGGRSSRDVTLIAVSKRQPVGAIRALYDAGHRDFGESRIEELEEKAAALPADVRWHWVGAMQRNKVRRIRALAHLVHSFDRPELADAWTRDAADVRVPPVLLQVNVGREPQKGGVLPEDAADALARLQGAGVPVRGLMTLPPLVDDPDGARPFFRELAALARKVDLPELSMGMSGDFEVAVEEGATLVRVGTTIFGPRSV